MLGIIGKKVGMTRVNDPQGRSIACTVVVCGPCTVTQIKEQAKDGYAAVQLGYDEKKAKNTSKALQGHFAKASATPKKRLVEFRGFQEAYEGDLKVGDMVPLEKVVREGDYVDVVGTSKGKGFQGVVKRYNFKGVGDRTHGQHNRERAPGSIGGASYPARVFKGMRMAGRMGGARVKIQNLMVLKVIKEQNLVLLQGAVPGAKNNYIILEK